MCNGSWVRAGSLTQHGQEIITLQLFMSVATMEEEIVGVSVRLNQAMRQRYPRHRHDSFEFPEAWVATSRLDHCLLA